MFVKVSIPTINPTILPLSLHGDIVRHIGMACRGMVVREELGCHVR